MINRNKLLSEIDSKTKATSFLKELNLITESNLVDARELFSLIFKFDDKVLSTRIRQYKNKCDIHDSEFEITKNGRVFGFYFTIDATWKMITLYRENNLIYGKGIRDVSEHVKVNGKLIPSYRKWCGILERCYSPEWHINKPTYKDCEISEDWRYFSNFKKWFDTNNINGYVLDKDILVKNNKGYSKETCIFVPGRINALTINRTNDRGEFPVGVTYRNDRNHNNFEASYTIGEKRKHIGFFDFQEEAFAAYKVAKETYIKEVALEYYERGEICQRAFDVLMRYEVSIND